MGCSSSKIDPPPPSVNKPEPVVYAAKRESEKSRREMASEWETEKRPPLPDLKAPASNSQPHTSPLFSKLDKKLDTADFDAEKAKQWWFY